MFPGAWKLAPLDSRFRWGPGVPNFERISGCHAETTPGPGDGQVFFPTFFYKGKELNLGAIGCDASDGRQSVLTL